MSWYPAPLPDLTGRAYLVTGANAGLGFFTAARLVGAGARVVMTGRSSERLDAAAGVIRERVAAGAGSGEVGGSVETLVMDQASLGSVAAGAATVLGRELTGGAPLDGIVLNAGIVHTPFRRQVSVDGRELVLATNVLGHFALLARLLEPAAAPAAPAPAAASPAPAAASPAAQPAPAFTAGARIVTLGSLSTLLTTFRVDDLQLERGYDPWRAYAQSKIAAASIAFELDRRLRAADAPLVSLVAHPGYSISGRTPFVPGVNEPSRGSRFADALQAAWAQGKHRGAEPILHAITADGVAGGQFWGPRGLVKGPPSPQRPVGVTTDPLVAARVWDVAERATGVRLDLERGPALEPGH
ncbi:SDR family NAD(P)-dependent oxidoreductase [Agromyces sp. CFH 90414]|uniref:SDR family NAD(P)-dependent oxidoreductase n=1 Tax=Agromyces agglutinans TaxID=2662258 RepID=A0A6I2FBF8_9MICO|nr:SDR family NAD(P)-dependent oxidoreductase [Agromyces agglutinans]MRG59263.1 SDR family NAD(P)-dependent oxidoreductase [Agromyces agglutinans]